MSFSSVIDLINFFAICWQKLFGSAPWGVSEWTAGTWERTRTHVGSHDGVRVRAAGRGVKVELESDELRKDVLPFLLEERGGEPCGLQAVDRLDQLRLPAGEDEARLSVNIARGTIGRDDEERGMTYCSAPSTSSMMPAMMVITRPTAPRTLKKVPMRPIQIAALLTSSPTSPASVNHVFSDLTRASKVCVDA